MKLSPARRTQRRYKPRTRKCKRPGGNVIFTPLANHGKYCCDICRKRDHHRRARRQNPPKKREPVLEIFVCDHCGNTFLANRGSNARYCSPSYKSMVYKHRHKATIRAIMGEMDCPTSAARQKHA